MPNIVLKNGTIGTKMENTLTRMSLMPGSWIAYEMFISSTGIRYPVSM